jgi:cytidylate kinase
MIITIDGPAGAGKTSAARGLARRLGFRYLDTGAMYRVVTLAALEQGIDLTDEAAVARVAESLDIRLEGDRVLVDDRDVSEAIRRTEVTLGSRAIAANAAVRRRLVELQRELGRGGNIVAEGRDQGTVVFPDAECKFFVTADPQERARRRHAELAGRGETVDFETVLAQQEDRDRRDRQRAVGPLVPAADAVHVDTTDRPLEAVIDELEQIVRERAGRG